MPRFPFNLPVPTAYYECQNVPWCLVEDLRIAECFVWWDPMSLSYTPTKQVLAMPLPEAPWEHQTLYLAERNAPTKGWWCCDCISRLEAYATPKPGFPKPIPMASWLPQKDENDDNELAVVLHNIREPEPYFKCGANECNLKVPPDDLLYCATTYSNAKNDTSYKQIAQDQKWLCPGHTDELTAQLVRNPTLSIRIGPSLQGLLDLKGERESTKTKRRRRAQRAPT